MTLTTAETGKAGAALSAGQPSLPLNVQIMIPGEPQGKARHRTGQGRTYTPKKTTQQEAFIRSLVLDAYPRLVPSLKPVEINILVWCRIPAAFNKARKLAAMAGELRPDKKPDQDNIQKLIYDAIQIPSGRKTWPEWKLEQARLGAFGFLIHDDSQIVESTYGKWFCTADRQPHTGVWVRDIAGCEGAYRK